MATNAMKKVQADWKNIGHVPRKFSDDIWKRFKAACNHYFERLKESKSEENAEEVAAFSDITIVPAVGGDSTVHVKVAATAVVFFDERI